MTSLKVDALTELVQSDEWLKWTDPTTLGGDVKSQERFLKNRIHNAVHKGIEIGAEVERQKLVQRFSELFGLPPRLL